MGLPAVDPAVTGWPLRTWLPGDIPEPWDVDGVARARWPESPRPAPEVRRTKGMVDATATNGGSDEELFSRVAAGDAASFAAFYDRHESLWFALALRIVQSVAEAEDVLQEAAVTIWERAPLYDPGQGRPVSWAITVVRNKAIDRVCARRRGGAACTSGRRSIWLERRRRRSPVGCRAGRDSGRMRGRSFDREWPGFRRSSDRRSNWRFSRG